MAPFPDEESLVDAVLDVDFLVEFFGYEDWSCWSAREFSGLFGVPDVLLGFGKRNRAGARLLRTVALEMKLRNWRRALVQAYRYAAFAHYSYVVLDEYHSTPAVRRVDLFERSNIGLVSCDRTGRLTVHYKPRYQTPYSPQLYSQLCRSLRRQLF